jgi:hypothetical protein
MSLSFICNVDEELDLSITNPNAVHLFALLQVEFDCEGSIGTKDLQRKIAAADRVLSARGVEFTRPARIAMSSSGAASIDPGLDVDRLKSYLDKLSDLAEVSCRADIKRITWS